LAKARALRHRGAGGAWTRDAARVVPVAGGADDRTRDEDSGRSGLSRARALASMNNAAALENRPRIPLRHVIAVFIGNGLEFYDFLTFSYFAVYISRTFFPPGNPSAALLATLAAFGAGFLTRPIGAIVIGGMGDRVGRKPAMIFSFTLMGVAIIGL